MKRNGPGIRNSRSRHGRAAALVAAGATLVGVPQLEAATFTVMNDDDAGAGSLRNAIALANAASDADTINFDPSVTAIALTSGELEITEPLTITGPGAGSLTIDAGDASRIFYIYNATDMIDVTITGVTASNGSTLYSGGAILNEGENLTLEDVTVSGSSAGCCGGGLASFDYPGVPNALVIRDSTISGNDSAFGGGIGLNLYEAASTALIENVTITGNTGLSSGGGIDATYLSGTLTIENSRISGNDGGFVGGGVASLYADQLRIAGSTIADNTAYNGGGVGLFVAVDVSIHETTITGNEATAVGGDEPVQAQGGGIFSYVAVDLEITNSTISGNSSLNGGGGIAIYGIYGQTYLQNSTVSGNQSTDPLAGYGGGIYLGYVSEGSAFVAEFATITGNTAGTAGGGIYAYLGPGSHVLLSSVIADNVAPDGSDAIGSFDTVENNTSFVGDTSTATFSYTVLSGDPMIGPLADNGGPTLTHQPLTGSPLIDAGTNPNALTTDQRGTPRVREFPAGQPDIGALEVQTGDGPSEFNFDPTAVMVPEGAGSTDLNVVRTNSSGAASVDVVVTGGTATGGGTDYTFSTVTLEFDDLEDTPRVVPVGITQDALDETNETIAFELQNAQNSTVGTDGSATVTILDDEAGTIQFDPTTYDVNEADGTVDVTVTRTGASDTAVSADVVVTGGSATGGGTDFTYATQMVSWAPGEAGARTVTFTITPDTEDEVDETIDVALQNVVGGASVGAAAAEVTILDDDVPGAIEFAQAAYAISEDGGSIEISLTRTGGSAGTVTADVSVTGGDAVGGGTDYTFGPTTLEWVDGDTAAKAFSIPIVDDSLIESDETITLAIENLTGGATSGAQATTTVTIQDEDSAGTLQFGAATYAVVENAGSIDVTVTRAGGSDGAVTVDVSLAGGTATDGVDYTFAPETLAWADGDVTPKTVSIPITDDSLIEPDETIELSLDNAGGGAAVGAQSTTTVTIADEDSAGSLGFGQATYVVNETDGTITITVTRLGGSDGEATVDVVITGGTATDGTDFTLGATTLVWPDGDDAPKSFTITIADDGIAEVPETIVLELQNPTGGATITEGTTTVTIISAAVAAAAIPTLDGWMRIVMAGLLGLLAVGVIRRGRFLASILFAAFLLSSSPALAADEQPARRAQAIELKSMEVDGEFVTLGLAGGESIRIESSRVRMIAPRRRGKNAKQLKSLAEGEKARVRVWRKRNGDVMFVTVLVGERLRERRPARQ